MIKKILLITAGFVLCFNANSFALVDVAAWGGYIFSGDDRDDSFKGPQLGLKAHYNTSLTPLFNLGVGAYCELSNFNYTNGDIPGEFDIIRKSAGLDVNLIFSLTPIVNPYFRGTWAFWEKIENDYTSNKENFKAFGLGLGVEFTIIPLLRIFGEYMYDRARHDDETYNFHAFNLGLKLNF